MYSLYYKGYKQYIVKMFPKQHEAEYASFHSNLNALIRLKLNKYTAKKYL